MFMKDQKRVSSFLFPKEHATVRFPGGPEYESTEKHSLGQLWKDLIEGFTSLLVYKFSPLGTSCPVALE